jgi:hypothetical protein
VLFVVFMHPRTGPELAARTTLLIDARFAPNVPIDAVSHGAANVRVVVSPEGHVVAETVITAGSPQTFTLDATASGTYQVTVDNNGDADTDWLLLTARGNRRPLHHQHAEYSSV